MRVLVCGGRDYTGDVTCLGQLDISILIHGDCRGADQRARDWAVVRGIHHAAVPALWDYYYKGAGFKRNSAMTLLLPEYCVAFPGGTGTNGMVELCGDLPIPIWKPYG